MCFFFKFSFSFIFLGCALEDLVIFALLNQKKRLQIMNIAQTVCGVKNEGFCIYIHPRQCLLLHDINRNMVLVVFGKTGTTHAALAALKSTKSPLWRNCCEASTVLQPWAMDKSVY